MRDDPQWLPNTPAPHEVRRARELVNQATLLACVLWVVVIASLSTPSRHERFTGHLKGNDFLQFYVLASAVRQGDFAALSSATGLRAEQLRMVPDSADARCQPVYGPQVGLLFAPFAWLPYMTAYASWAALTLVIVLLCARALWLQSPELPRWRRAVFAAALAYPPFVYLVFVGQVSALALLLFTVFTSAVSRGRFWLQATSLGLLAYKPSLFGPAAAMLLLAGEWRLVAAACAVAVAQAAAAVPVVGGDVVRGYVLNTLGFIANPDQLVVNGHLMQSLRSFWVHVCSPGWARVGYMLSALATLALGARQWRRESSALARVGALAVCVCLVSPHLYTYDLVILAPALLASLSSFVAMPRTRLAGWHRRLTYLAYLGAFPGVGLAAATGVPLYPLVLAAWLVSFSLVPAEGNRRREDVRPICAPRLTDLENSAAR